MAVRHLTDDEIQAYLEKGTSSLDQVFDAHLNECRECRSRAEEFRTLFQSLAEDRAFDLSPGFSETVITRIAAEDVAGAKQRWTTLLGSIGGTIAALVAIGYFMDLRSLLRNLEEVFAPSIQRSVQTLGQAQQSVSGDGGNTLLVILFCLLILGAVAGADHLLFRGRTAKFSL